jgi:hypothetical protein
MAPKKKTSTIPRKRAKYRYTEQEKTNALRILQVNSLNFLKTEQETGISRQALKRWVDDDKTGVVVQKLKSELVEHEENKTPETIRAALLEDSIGTRVDILKRIKELTPFCKDIDQLSRAYKILAEVETGSNKTELPGNVTLNNYTTYLHVINNKLEEQKSKKQ